MRAAVATILLVEDSPDEQALTLMALAEAEVRSSIDVVHDGLQALDYLLGDGRPLPRLVLLDLKLPKIDGLGVLRRLRRNRRTRLLPVVILTTSREDHDVREAYASGANGYVRKPVDFDEFTRTVRQLGRYWLTINEPPPAVRP